MRPHNENRTTMNIEDFRAYCLSLKGVTEKMPFGKAASEYDRNLLVFSVLDKWFCFVNVDVFDFCDLKCDPELRGHPPRLPHEQEALDKRLLQPRRARQQDTGTRPPVV